MGVGVGTPGGSVGVGVAVGPEVGVGVGVTIPVGVGVGVTIPVGVGVGVEAAKVNVSWHAGAIAWGCA